MLRILSFNFVRSRLTPFQQTPPYIHIEAQFVYNNPKKLPIIIVEVAQAIADQNNTETSKHNNKTNNR